MTAKSPPGYSGISAFKYLTKLRKTDPLSFWRKAQLELGDTIKFGLGPVDLWFFAQPAAIYEILVTMHKSMRKGVGYAGLRKLLGEGLITSDNTHWATQRKLLNPIFAPANLSAYTQSIHTACDAGISELNELAGASGTINIDHAMTRFTMRIISQAAFGVDLGKEHNDVVSAFEFAFAFVADMSIDPVRLPLLFPTVQNRKFKHSLRIINQFIDELIHQSKQQNRTGSMSSDIFAALKDNDHKLLRDEIISLYFAGFETTARTMTFLMAALARHPDVLSQLQKESENLNAIANNCDIQKQFPLTTEVVNEALRLYPPVAMMARQSNNDCTIDGFEIRKNAILIVCPFIAQRNQEFWPAGKEFQPDFKLPLERRLPHRGAFVPFGAGPRICLGKHFAIVEMVLALTMICRSFNWELVANKNIELDFHGTLRPKSPIYIKLQKRMSGIRSGS